jgi:hypothetical protein
MTKPVRPAPLAAALLLALAPAPASAQTILGGFKGESEADYFGYVVDGLGDVDGDGIGDALVATYAAVIGGHPDVGLVRIYSGATHALLMQKTGSLVVPDGFAWAATRLGDVNGDGRGDFAVGLHLDSAAALNAGSVRVYSGATGALLWNQYGSSAGERFGFSLGLTDDVNGDGRADLLIGAPFNDASGQDAGRVRLVSGADGSLLQQFFGRPRASAWASSSPARATSMATAKATSRWAHLTSTPSAAGSTCARARTGALLFSLEGEAAGDQMGRTQCGVGDVDGDGHGDLALGLRWDDFGGHDAGDARLVSGADGSTLWEVHGDGGSDLFGWAVSPIGDVNHDGRPDVVVGAPRYDGSVVDEAAVRRACTRVGTETIIYTLLGNAPEDQFGSALAPMGDIDLDGEPDLIVGAWGDGSFGGESGAAWLVSGYTPWLNLGLALDAAPDELTLTGGGALLPGTSCRHHADILARRAARDARGRLLVDRRALPWRRHGAGARPARLRARAGRRRREHAGDDLARGHSLGLRVRAASLGAGRRGAGRLHRLERAARPSRLDELAASGVPPGHGAARAADGDAGGARARRHQPGRRDPRRAPERASPSRGSRSPSRSPTSSPPSRAWRRGGRSASRARQSSPRSKPVTANQRSSLPAMMKSTGATQGEGRSMSPSRSASPSSVAWKSREKTSACLVLWLAVLGDAAQQHAEGALVVLPLEMGRHLVVLGEDESAHVHLDVAVRQQDALRRRELPGQVVAAHAVDLVGGRGERSVDRVHRVELEDALRMTAGVRRRDEPDCQQGGAERQGDECLHGVAPG